MHNAKCMIHNLRLAFCILYCALCIAACSVPNLESSECSEARDAAKRFYSFHFGNDMKPSLENLKLRERFLTDQYFSRLMDAQNAGGDAEHDPFTPYSEKGLPRTFKIGKCREISDTVVDLQVQFYWRDDNSTEQKELHAEMVRTSGVWLLERTSSGAVP
jgi:hypothetical protein